MQVQEEGGIGGRMMRPEETFQGRSICKFVDCSDDIVWYSCVVPPMTLLRDPIATERSCFCSPYTIGLVARNAALTGVP